MLRNSKKNFKKLLTEEVACKKVVRKGWDCGVEFNYVIFARILICTFGYGWNFYFLLMNIKVLLLMVKFRDENKKSLSLLTVADSELKISKSTVDKIII